MLCLFVWTGTNIRFAFIGWSGKFSSHLAVGKMGENRFNAFEMKRFFCWNLIDVNCNRSVALYDCEEALKSHVLPWFSKYSSDCRPLRGKSSLSSKDSGVDFLSRKTPPCHPWPSAPPTSPPHTSHPPPSPLHRHPTCPLPIYPHPWQRPTHPSLILSFSDSLKLL